MATIFSTPRTKVPPFAGAPRNHEARRKDIVRTLLANAKEAEVRAEQCRKLAALVPTVEHLRDRNTLRKLVQSEDVGWGLADLFGLRDAYYEIEAHDKRFWLHCVIDGYSRVNSPVGMRSKPSLTNINTRNETRMPFNAVTEAQRIACKAATGGFDGQINWLSEPQTATERRVRIKLIEKIFTENGGTAFAHWDLQRLGGGVLSRPEFYATDLACAYRIVDELMNEADARRRAEGIAEAQRVALLGDAEDKAPEDNEPEADGDEETDRRLADAWENLWRPFADEALRRFRERYASKYVGGADV